MSAEARFYYVDAQNQAAGPIAMAGLLALKAAGTVNEATLVVIEGGTEWVAFSTLKAEGASKGGAGSLPSSAPEGGPTSGPTSASHSSLATSPSSSPSAEPLWASQLAQKIDELISAMEKLSVAVQKSRPSSVAVMAPATASLHAEKISLNTPPKPGIASLNPNSPPAPLPTPLPAGIPVTSPKPVGLPTATPRPGVNTPLTPLAVPANAQKSALPLPALGKAPGPNPAGIPKPVAPPSAAAPAKGNIFSKFLKK